MRKHPGKALTNMVLSCVLCSIAVNWVALPNGFVVTGITGLSMAAAQFTGVNYALIYYGLALAILLCTALALGWREVSNILVLSLLYPVVLWGLNHIQVEIILQESSSRSCSSVRSMVWAPASPTVWAIPMAGQTPWPSC